MRKFLMGALLLGLAANAEFVLSAEHDEERPSGPAAENQQEPPERQAYQCNHQIPEQ